MNAAKYAEQLGRAVARGDLRQDLAMAAILATAFREWREAGEQPGADPIENARGTARQMLLHRDHAADSDRWAAAWIRLHIRPMIDADAPSNAIRAAAHEFHARRTGGRYPEWLVDDAVADALETELTDRAVRDRRETPGRRRRG